MRVAAPPRPEVRGQAAFAMSLLRVTTRAVALPSLARFTPALPLRLGWGVSPHFTGEGTEAQRWGRVVKGHSFLPQKMRREHPLCARPHAGGPGFATVAKAGWGPIFLGSQSCGSDRFETGQLQLRVMGVMMRDTQAFCGYRQTRHLAQSGGQGRRL